MSFILELQKIFPCTSLPCTKSTSNYELQCFHVSHNTTGCNVSMYHIILQAAMFPCITSYYRLQCFHVSHHTTGCNVSMYYVQTIVAESAKCPWHSWWKCG